MQPPYPDPLRGPGRADLDPKIRESMPRIYVRRKQIKIIRPVGGLGTKMEGGEQ